MIDFQKLKGPFGIPVYFQKLPDSIGAVAMQLIMFTGSADDESVGLPGVHHWFEHVPFRGTESYDHADIHVFERHGGEINAHTGNLHTSYEFTVPKRMWWHTFDVMVELAACPRLHEDDIEKERRVIFKEIKRNLSDPLRHAFEHYQELLWPNHPLGHSPLGTIETLKATDLSTLRKVHEQGYARCRCAVVIAGNLEIEEVLKRIEKPLAKLPSCAISERRGPISHGALPLWQGGQETIINITVPSSVVILTFPIEAPGTPRVVLSHLSKWILLNETVAAFNSAASPLMSIVREQRQLAYETGGQANIFPDGGIWSIFASTEVEQISQTCEAFWDTLNDKWTRSEVRREYVLDSESSILDMRPINAHDYVSKAADRLIETGIVYSDQDYVEAIRSISHEQILGMLDSLTPDRARLFIFKGQG